MAEEQPLQFDVNLNAYPREKKEEDLFTSSLRNDSPIAAALNWIDRSGFNPDFDYQFDEAEQKRLFGDLGADQFEEATYWVSRNTVSAKHSEFMRDQYMEELKREQLFSEAGGEGLAVRMLANLLDPANIALAFATGGLGHLTKAGALRGALRTGAWTAAEAAALEGAVAASSGMRDSSDIVLSALGAFALGAGVGKALDTPEYAKAVNLAVERQHTEEVVEALERAGLDSAGAMRAGRVTNPLVEAEIAREFDIETAADVPTSALGGVRWDAVGRLGQDADPAARSASRKMAEESTGVAGYGVVERGASEIANLVHRTLMTPFRRDTEPLVEKWTQELGLGWSAKHSPAQRSEFYSQVGDAVRGIPNESKSVQKTAAIVSEVFDEYRESAARVNVLGMRDVPPNKNYLPRVRNAAAIREMTVKYGEDNLVKLISKAFRANHEDLTKEVADRIAKGYFRRIRRLSVGMDTGIAHGLRTDDVDFLRQVLDEAGLEDDLIETTIAQTKKATEKASRVTRAKKRLDIDETTTADIDGETVRVVDLFERDAEKLLFNYSRTMSGWIGLARQMNVKSPGEWEKFIRMIRSRGEELGQAQDVIDAKVDRFNFLFRGITGMPLETDPASLYARAARGARDYNFLRIGAAFGFAQLAEIGQMVGTTGFRNVLAHVPALRGMVKRGVDGKLTDQLAAEIEDMIAPGVDRLLNMPSTRWDEHGYGIADTGIWSKVDNAVQVAKRVTGDIGGLSAATIVFQRMGARAVMQKLLGFAHGAKLTKGQARRLRGMGMSDAMQKRVFEQMRKHATTESSFVPGGRKLRALNPDRWEDADALDELTFSVHREARRIVQENDIGASTPWLHSTTGKLMTQFRTFMLTAWSKATLHNIHHHDLQAFQLLTTSMFAAGLAYIAQQSINVGDRKEREKRLEPAEIAKAAFQRTAVASIGPALFDTTATTLFRLDPQFSFGRSSGLASDLVRGAPVVDLYDRVARAAGIPALIARPDEEFTKREYRNIHGLLPVIGGLAGMRRVGDMLIEELPD